MNAAIYDVLRGITTATITTMLLKKGIRRCWMQGPQPLVATGRRLVGPAFTLRFVPVREGVLASELPVWCAGLAAPASVNGLTFVGWQEPIGCGGCAIFPDDVIVCDDDGAVVIPQNLVAFVAEEGREHERMESFIVAEVEAGAKLPGLYPMNAETKARYEAWKKKQ
jgi:regulator of RNase E activity RraA